jgi:hypothetical protein
MRSTFEGKRRKYVRHSEIFVNEQDSGNSILAVKAICVVALASFQKSNVRLQSSYLAVCSRPFSFLIPDMQTETVVERHYCDNRYWNRRDLAASISA